MESARRARSEDREAITALVEAACREVEGVRGGALLVASQERLGRRIGVAEANEEATAHVAAAGGDGSDGRCVVVGTVDDVTVGVGAAEVDVMGSARVATIGLLYVEPAARGGGVGELMLAELQAWSAAQGCTGVDVPVLPGDRATKSFLEGNGYVARLLTLHREICHP